MRTVDKAVAAWTKQWCEEHLAADVRKMIGQANFDLYHGPVGDGAFGDPAEDNDEWASYPGFTKACDAIARALEDLPDTLYLDLDSGDASETEPAPERCEACDGDGCDECHGRGCFESCGEWYELPRRVLVRDIVGHELAAHV